MGQGTFVLFNNVAKTIGDGDQDFQSGGEDYAVSLITNAVVAAATDADPELGDYTECSGGTYVKQALANQDNTLADEVSSFVADSVTFDQDAGSGPTDCYQAIVHIDDSPYKCVGFIDLTEDGGVTPLSLQDAPIVLNFGSGSRKLINVSIPANAT